MLFGTTGPGPSPFPPRMLRVGVVLNFDAFSRHILNIGICGRFDGFLGDKNRQILDLWQIWCIFTNILHKKNTYYRSHPVVIKDEQETWLFSTSYSVINKNTPRKMWYNAVYYSNNVIGLIEFCVCVCANCPVATTVLINIFMKYFLAWTAQITFALVIHRGWDMFIVQCLLFVFHIHLKS